jgi:hypothetical protein
MHKAVSGTFSIKRVLEVDPLVCPSCSGEMRIIAFIIDHEDVPKLLH